MVCFAECDLPDLVQKIGQVRCSTFSIAHCRRKVGLCAEIALKRFNLSVLDSEIFHVPERFTVLCVTKILHKSVLRSSGHPLQVNMFNEFNLCVPASRFESTLADMVVACRARKGE